MEGSFIFPVTHQILPLLTYCFGSERALIVFNSNGLPKYHTCSRSGGPENSETDGEGEIFLRG